MSDKVLSTKEWQRFAAGRGYKDAAFVKALTAVERLETPGRELDELQAQSQALLKLHKGDKELAGWLDTLPKALERRRRELEEAESESEAGEHSALLDPANLLKQLQLCKKDPQRRIEFGFVDGPAAGVLALSPKVAGRKLYAQLCDASGGKTGAYGSLRVVEMELLLQIDKPLSGLVKKLRAVLHDCGFRAKAVVICGPDGAEFERDADPTATQADDAAPAPAAASIESAAPPTEPPAEPPTEQPAETPARPAAPATGAITARLKALMPRIVAVAGSREGIAAKQFASDAAHLAQSGDLSAAEAALAKAEQLLSAGTPGAAEAPLRAWRQARDAAVVTLKALAAEAAAEKDEESADAVREVQAVVKQLTAEPGTAQQVLELQRWLGEDDVVADVCDMGHDIRVPLLAVLAPLQAALN